MKAIQLNAKTLFTNHQLLLLGIGTCLIAVHLGIAWKGDYSNLFGSSIVFLAAISSLIWDRRHTLHLESGIIASIFGSLLIALVLLISLFVTNSGIALYLFPLIAGLGLALLASGFKGLKQYWVELFALFCLAASKVLTPYITDISPLTAKFAALLLWCSGFKFVMSGQKILTETGGIDVYPGCSGMESIIQMLGLALIFIIMFSLNNKQKILATIVAATLAFVVNGVRVALMAVIVSNGDHKNFVYWHEGDGSATFSIATVIIFGLFCWLLLWFDSAKNKDVKES
jgi:cyanoexosortase A